MLAIQTGTSINQSAIDLLEKSFAVTFPDDYKTFLKQYNGFRVASPDNCDIPFDKVDTGKINEVIFISISCCEADKTCS